MTFLPDDLRAPSAPPPAHGPRDLPDLADKLLFWSLAGLVLFFWLAVAGLVVAFVL